MSMNTEKLFDQISYNETGPLDGDLGNVLQQAIEQVGRLSEESFLRNTVIAYGPNMDNGAVSPVLTTYWFGEEPEEELDEELLGIDPAAPVGDGEWFSVAEFSRILAESLEKQGQSFAPFEDGILDAKDGSCTELVIDIVLVGPSSVGLDILFDFIPPPYDERIEPYRGSRYGDLPSLTELIGKKSYSYILQKGQEYEGVCIEIAAALHDILAAVRNPDDVVHLLLDESWRERVVPNAKERRVSEYANQLTHASAVARAYDRGDLANIVQEIITNKGEKKDAWARYCNQTLAVRGADWRFPAVPLQDPDKTPIQIVKVFEKYTTDPDTLGRLFAALQKELKAYTTPHLHALTTFTLEDEEAEVYAEIWCMKAYISELAL